MEIIDSDAMPHRLASGLMRRLDRWISDLPLSDAETLRHAVAVQKAVLSVSIAVVFSLALVYVAQPSMLPRVVDTTAYHIGALVIALYLARTGWSRTGTGVFIAMLLVSITINALRAGGIRSPGIQSYFILAMLAAHLLGEGAGIATALACLGISFSFVVCETTGLLPAKIVPYNPWTLLILNAMYVLILLVIMRLTTRELREELERRRKTERRLELALSAANIGIWEKDPATGAYLGDDRSFELFNLPRRGAHRLEFEAWRDLVDPEDLPRLMEALGRLDQGDARVQADYRVHRRDGVTRHMEIVATSVAGADGRPLEIVGMIADATERRSAERERERLLRDLGERVKELRLLHAATRLLQAGRPFDRALLQQLVGLMPAAWLHPESCQARIVYLGIEVATPGWRDASAKLSAPFATSEGKGVIEVAYLDEKPAEVEGPFLKEERSLLNSLTEMLVAHAERYATERRQEELEHQLRQSQKMESLGSLAGGVAHDFNNLLTAILGYAELLAEQCPDKDPRRQDAEEIIATSHRAAALTRQLLAFSRKQILNPEVVNLSRVAGGIQNMLGRIIGENVRMETRLAPDLACCRADPSQLEQVILNLVVNARDAMPKGGAVTVTTSAGRLDAAEAAALGMGPGDVVRLAVSDTGIGMSEATLRRIFEPFFTTKPLGKGTGLGLSTVYGIVKQSSGAVRVRSESGRGATFEVLLPAVAEEEAPAPGAASLTPPYQNQETLLLVDDDAGVRTVTERLLRAEGFVVVTADGPQAALEILRDLKTTLHLLITDFVMPGMDGEELSRAARGLRPGLKVLYISGYQDRLPADRAAAWFHLQKPFTAARLAEMVREALKSPPTEITD